MFHGNFGPDRGRLLCHVGGVFDSRHREFLAGAV